MRESPRNLRSLAHHARAEADLQWRQLRLSAVKCGASSLARVVACMVLVAVGAVLLLLLSVGTVLLLGERMGSHALATFCVSAGLGVLLGILFLLRKRLFTSLFIPPLQRMLFPFGHEGKLTRKKLDDTLKETQADIVQNHEDLQKTLTSSRWLLDIVSFLLKTLRKK